MPIDRNLWRTRFETWPVLPCPTCGSKALSIVKDSVARRETGLSRLAHSEPAWEVSWVDERFTAHLVCGNVDCQNVVVACGRVDFEEENYYDNEGATRSNVRYLYLPQFFCAAPPVFPIAAECPGSVRSELEAAFALLWSDVGSAANRVRAGVEALLTERGVARTTRNGKGKRQPLSLHARIDKYKQASPEAAPTLFALKWLGNDGSHASPEGVDINNLLDAFELFEHAIETIYVKRTDKLKRLASSINKKRGPLHRKPKVKSFWP
jgi:Domain of unknown function (DUF4145)